MKTNWLGNISFKQAAFVRVESENQLIGLVKKARLEQKKIRVVGAGHSWTPVCQTDGYLVNLDKISGLVALDETKLTATVKAGTRLKHLNELLWDKGFALSNLGSIAEQSVAGATATATHGTGIGFGNLATAIIALKIIDGNGDLRTYSIENNPELFPAFPVSFGVLGIITEFTLKIVTRFYLEEHRKPLLFEAAIDQLPELIHQADHFKLWWFPFSDKVQTYSSFRRETFLPIPKRFNMLREDSKVAHGIFSFLLRLGNIRALVPSINRFITNIQFKTEINLGRSFEIFTMAMPPKHHEGEYAIAVERAGECLTALRKLILEHRHPVNFVTEIRFVKADNLWLSPCYGQDVCYIGGYMAGESGYADYLEAYETLMLSFGGRPHWGKEFSIEKQNFETTYSRWNDFKSLRTEMDPNGLFENDWTKKLFG
jgi:L-gulonolactone oxidase